MMETVDFPEATERPSHAGVPVQSMMREPERYRLRVVASAQIALIRSQLDVLAAHSLKWQSAISSLSRLPLLPDAQA